MIFRYFKGMLFVAIFLFVLILTPCIVSAEEGNNVTVYFFHSQDCPHCHEEAEFLDKYAESNPDIDIQRYEIKYNKDNSKLLGVLGRELGVKITSVPITLINNKALYGYLDDATTGKQIEDAVNACLEDECPDPVGPIIEREQGNLNIVVEGESESTEIDIEGDNKIEDIKEIPEKLSLPLFGEIETKSFSIPLLTVIIGGIDGFNPCAMWVLLFLISLLLGMKNRKRMWILGVTFIVASSLAYFLFMVAWLNLFIFLSLITWIRVVIGLVAIVSGFYYLRDYWTNRDGCKTVGGSERRQKIFAKLREFSQSKKFYIALGGIILVAFAVNLVELLCSAGLPAIYTNILSLSDLPSWQYYMYILLYILIFMLDDLIVFVIAMVTLKAVGISKKYTRYVGLIGGIIILILGVLLIFRPEWLMFG